MHEAIPKAQRIALLADHDPIRNIDALQNAGRALGVEIVQLAFARKEGGQEIVTEAGRYVNGSQRRPYRPGLRVGAVLGVVGDPEEVKHDDEEIQARHTVIAACTEGLSNMAIRDHDVELLKKIHRIRSEGWEVGLVARQAGVDPSKTLLEDAPQIICSTQYGRDAVLAAVKDANAEFARLLIERILRELQ